jgi:hypothetical protein
MPLSFPVALAHRPPYTFPMIIKIYWVARVLGYVACMVGIFLFLAHQADADPATKNMGIGLVGIGFLGFFISYALRVWLRFGPRRLDDQDRLP